jgi:hypothetical protein
LTEDHAGGVCKPESDASLDESHDALHLGHLMAARSRISANKAYPQLWHATHEASPKLPKRKIEMHETMARENGLAKNMSTMSKYRPMSPVRAGLLALRPTGMMAGPTATVEDGDQQTL